MYGCMKKQLIYVYRNIVKSLSGWTWKNMNEKCLEKHIIKGLLLALIVFVIFIVTQVRYIRMGVIISTIIPIISFFYIFFSE